MAHIGFQVSIGAVGGGGLASQTRTAYDEDGSDSSGSASGPEFGTAGTLVGVAGLVRLPHSDGTE